MHFIHKIIKKKNKKAAFLSMGMIISIAILTLSFVMIAGLWNKAISKAEPAAAEKLCESFNAARMSSSWDLAGKKFTFVPDACKTIHKEGKTALPESGFTGSRQGTQENIANLAVKCWDMWLKGSVDNMFDSTVFPWGNQECFICYTFNIEKGIDPFTSSDMEIYLGETVYFADDTSDKCALTDTGYGGGYCMPECTGTFSEEVSSTKCVDPSASKCCIAQDKKDECINKGGRCAQSCNSDEKAFLPPDGWKCSGDDEICCIEENDVYTYNDYIQTYAGQGRIFIDPSVEFCPLGSDCADTYAIVFGARTTHWSWFEDPVNINNIAITSLNDVSNICNVQMGTSGE